MPRHNQPSLSIARKSMHGVKYCLLYDPISNMISGFREWLERARSCTADGSKSPRATVWQVYMSRSVICTRSWKLSVRLSLFVMIKNCFVEYLNCSLRCPGWAFVRPGRRVHVPFPQRDVKFAVTPALLVRVRECITIVVYVFCRCRRPTGSYLLTNTPSYSLPFSPNQQSSRGYHS